MIRMRSTNYVGCSAGLLAALALGTAEAQTPSVKIGVVNMTALTVVDAAVQSNEVPLAAAAQ